MAIGEDDLRGLREAIDELARLDAPELIAEARAEARTKVRAILADAIASSMLEEARRELGARERRTAPAATPAPAPAPAQVTRASAPAPVADLGWYLYGVIGPDEVDLEDAPRGVDGTHPLEILREGGLGAVVSRVPLDEFGEDALRSSLEDLAWLEDKARAHEDALARLRLVTTVIPMRLCTIYATEESLRRWVSREQAPLADALARLGGRTEWGVKVFSTREDLSALARQNSPEVAELAEQIQTAAPGEAYLLRRRLDDLVHERASELLADCGEAAHGRFAAVAEEALTNPLQPREVTGHDGDMVLNGVYLVADSAADVFHAEVDAVREEYAALGLEVEPTGPWPPYNFVKGLIEAAR